MRKRIYQNTHQSTPGLRGTSGTIDGVKAGFRNNTDGFATRTQMTRNFQTPESCPNPPTPELTLPSFLFKGRSSSLDRRASLF
jgi:hypothetical protein